LSEADGNHRVEERQPHTNSRGAEEGATIKRSDWHDVLPI
jgi:hypothetical protein